MDKITLTPPAAEALARALPQPAEALASSAAQAPADRTDLQPPAAALAPNRLVVHFDQDASRFVQTLSDASTQEVIRRYPSESQLAYARAVMAYLRALSQT